MIERADGFGLKGQSGADHENHAEPECHAGDDGEARDLARSKAACEYIQYRTVPAVMRGKPSVKEIA